MRQIDSLNNLEKTIIGLSSDDRIAAIYDIRGNTFDTPFYGFRNMILNRLSIFSFFNLSLHLIRIQPDSFRS